MVSSWVYSSRPLASSECMNELRTALSMVWRNSVRGIRNAWTFTPPAFSARLDFSTFLSSMVTSARSMSDFSQTVSCERLPQRMAARIERSPFTCATSSSSASANLFWTDPVKVLMFQCLSLQKSRLLDLVNEVYNGFPVKTCFAQPAPDTTNLFHGFLRPEVR